jgi:excisionase family DNA binding protein
MVTRAPFGSDRDRRLPTMSIADEFFDAVAESIARRLKEKFDRPSEHRLLTLEEAAEYLGYTPAAVRHMVAKGQLRCVRIGRTVRLDVTDLERCIEDHKSDGSR